MKLSLSYSFTTDFNGSNGKAVYSGGSQAKPGGYSYFGAGVIYFYPGLIPTAIPFLIPGLR